MAQSEGAPAAVQHYANSKAMVRQIDTAGRCSPAVLSEAAEVEGDEARSKRWKVE